MPPNPRDLIVVQQDLLNEPGVEDLPAWGVGVRDAPRRWGRAREGKGSKVKSHLVYGGTPRGYNRSVHITATSFGKLQLPLHPLLLAQRTQFIVQ